MKTMFRVCLVSVFVSTASAVVPIPPTPPVTEVQRQVIEKNKAIAAEAAPQGRADLMKMMESDAFQSYLKGFNSEHAGKSSTELYQLLKQQIEVAEIIHNWDPYARSDTHIVDITLNTSVDYPIFFTNWQLTALGLSPAAGNTGLQNAAEVMVYNLPDFTMSPPDYTEASNRFPYGAMNIQKIATGVPKFGSISTVFNNSYIRNQTILFANDSGQFEMACNKSQPNFANVTLDCSKYRPVATFDNWEHAFVANSELENTTIPQLPGVTPETHAEYNLALKLSAFLSTNYSTVPNITSSTLFTFVEASPFMNLEWENGVKMLILTYRSNLFGSAAAAVLRTWAVKQNWVLVWANDREANGNDTSNYKSNERFVDAEVLAWIRAGQNFTSDPKFAMAKSQFNEHYNNVNATLPTIPADQLPSFYSEQWDIAWSMFEGSVLQVEPLYAGACANTDCAAVRTIDKACICDQNVNKP
eukprot:TRINITY_DN4974_c0_g1_i1.p1 TRINITY_DN4974_c0_g1~~TRINITY_DN4974_c0_g1_i1.p1  ORF type:complete len:472 (+),score=113.05 TRINITY_DN4974_c0_g1_i1:53-1468(+)